MSVPTVQTLLFLAVSLLALSIESVHAGSGGTGGDRDGGRGNGDRKRCGPPPDDFPTDVISEKLDGASCLNGEDFYYFIRPGNPEFVLFVISGGGFCVSEFDCSTDSSIPVSFWLGQEFGFIEGVPFKDDILQWTVVWIPQCTEDFQIGAAQDQLLPPFTSMRSVNFAGGINIQLLIDRIEDDEDYQINQYVNFDNIKHLALWGLSSGCVGAAAWGFTFFDKVSENAVKTLVLDSWAIGNDFQNAAFPSIVALYNLAGSPVLDAAPEDLKNGMLAGSVTLSDLVVGLQEKYCELFVSSLYFSFDDDQPQRYVAFAAANGGIPTEWLSYTDPAVWTLHMQDTVLPEASYAPKRHSYYVANATDHVVIIFDEEEADELSTGCEEDQTMREYLHDVFNSKRDVWWYYGKPEKRVKTFPKYSYNSLDNNCVQCDDPDAF